MEAMAEMFKMFYERPTDELLRRSSAPIELSGSFRQERYFKSPVMMDGPSFKAYINLRIILHQIFMIRLQTTDYFWSSERSFHD